MFCVERYNPELWRTVDLFRWVLICLLMSTIFISILCYKWRGLAALCLYIECVMRTVVWFIPNSYNEELGPVDLTMNSTLYFVTFYCDRPDHLIFGTVHLTVEIFFGFHYAYIQRKPLTIGNFTLDIFMIGIYFVCTAVVGMAFIYTVDLRSTVIETNQENVKLLNGMHEGLVVLQKRQHSNGQRTQAEQRNIMFCNKPAQKLFDNYIGKLPIGEQKVVEESEGNERNFNSD